MSSTQLYFNYPSTARIRIKKENCLYCEDYPCIYRIVTKKLDFIIPRNAVIFGTKEEHKHLVFIPLSIYREKLTQFYSKIKR